MNKKIMLSTLVGFLLLGTAVHSLDPKSVRAASFRGTNTLVLYDAASGSVPSAPLLGFTDFPPGAALPRYTEGVTMMDTTADSDIYAGWAANGASISGFPLLERTTGFQLNFTAQVENEDHANNHRAGFSVIVLGEDAKGIEIAFWENEIWAQSDDTTGGLFRHGEGIAFGAGTGLIDYRLTIIGDTYTLSANTQPVLTGPLRDYSTFDEFPDPYETPNFLFLGDDTTSAQARVRLSFVSITGTEPVTPTNTITPTIISSPFPFASSTPLPSATPIPTPTPAGRIFEICPSGWIFLATILTPCMLVKKIRAGQ